MTYSKNKKRQSSGLIKIKLDDIVIKNELDSGTKYADEIRVYKDNELVVVIEEARKPKREDVDQVIKTIDAIKNNHPALKEVNRIIKQYCEKKMKMIGIVHGLRSVDSIVSKYAMKNHVIPVNCYSKLDKVINTYIELTK